MHYAAALTERPNVRPVPGERLELHESIRLPLDVHVDSLVKHLSISEEQLRYRSYVSHVDGDTIHVVIAFARSRQHEPLYFLYIDVFNIVWGDSVVADFDFKMVEMYDHLGNQIAI